MPTAVHTVTATEACKNFSEVLHYAHYSGEVIIEKNGKPFVSLTPIRTPLTGEQILRNRSRRKRFRLPPDEAAKFADDVENARKIFNAPIIP